MPTWHSCGPVLSRLLCLCSRTRGAPDPEVPHLAIACTTLQVSSHRAYGWIALAVWMRRSIHH
eukprot:365881-Chlamydomonas_euryale.AAC.8